MFETYTTVIGTVVSEPRRRQTTTGEDVISFRVACTSRRIDKRSGEWVDGPTLYLTVSCWRRLLAGVGLAIAKGRPVMAHGQIKTNEYPTADGSRRSDLEMTAVAVGLDLSRCIVTYRGTPSSERDIAAALPVAAAEKAETQTAA
ncbi:MULTISPECIES: single-stranded DNA-binding protein [Gordonia]|jgi:single-strand DNA-binding protein|uniref:Single-stranded DNA-binding protein n=4 Tax=Gordonia TaxID=2053 RepID=A0AAW4G992_GORRU|nr:MULTISPECIES: single-stranded DNA-binding protein [Gordonia]ASR03845.1 Single-stranded DNA-binding protein [Gordonia rubripertincta]ETA08003.1 single-stranded DNA-binding protein [Gordonia alkanivorans CGMCC 6845]KAF0970564.1 Single-stranded DNA-binding protein [Gordonia sp. YY1]MBM7279451.1 single-stranded DNA-binding protein [Gordonia rubripertincta]MCZ0913613.1 single-stranded DNA-binding protein [Gordonia amicalis]